jgi:hypothetical protein
MSLQVAAQHLASKGRDGDSTLVHMSPGEVKGLQALAMAHGGSLTINPDTGLVEANFLKRILPMVAGAALTGLSGGLINPFTASMIVGGFEGVRTGDLGKGLMAGLGAYGGAGLTSGLTSAGTQAVGKTATDATVAANPQLTGGEIAREMGTAGFNTPTLATNTNPATMSGLDKVSAGFKAGPSAIYNAAPTGTFPALATTTAAAITPEQKPIGGLPTEKSSGEYISKDFRAFVPNTPNPYYRPQGLGYTGYAAEGGLMPNDLSYANGGMVDPMQRMPNGGLAAIQGMRDGYSAPMTMDGNIPQFNEGGKLQMKRMKIGDGIFKDTNPNTANLGADEAAEYYVKNAAKRNKVPYAKMPKTNVENLGEINVGIAKAAAGGSIGGYSDGGRMLRGPGDGMSDSIPGVIGKRQPARLADGEFVVPADVVSHLGNGSTDAGAKRLYAMMDKVRHARTGNKKQGKKIKPEKYMPA